MSALGVAEVLLDQHYPLAFRPSPAPTTSLPRVLIPSKYPPHQAPPGGLLLDNPICNRHIYIPNSMAESLLCPQTAFVGSVTPEASSSPTLPKAQGGARLNP